MAKESLEKTIEVKGIVASALPRLEYTVAIDFKGIKHNLMCHVSGKMKKNFIKIEKGDEVLVKISLYDIDKGIIVRRLTSRQPVGAQPAQPAAPVSEVAAV